jgi:hypothetical protein
MGYLLTAKNIFKFTFNKTTNPQIMKITKEQFEEMKAKYDVEVRIGKPAQGSKGEIRDQTNWISYTKEDLMEVLSQEGVTGIKFHFTEYSQKVAEDFYGEDADQYVGRLNLVYSPIGSSSVDKQSARGAGDEYYDKGQTCPPICQ